MSIFAVVAAVGRRTLKGFFLPFLALCLVGVSCGSEQSKKDPTPELSGYEREPTPIVGDVVLPEVQADGAEADFAFKAVDSDLMLVFFGYTSCPDVCPTTLADIRKALKDLADDAERVSTAMVTIDVEVDTPALLTSYLQSFVPEGHAIRSVDDPALQEAAAAFGATYGKSGADGDGEVFHSGSVYVVNAAGELVLTWPFGTSSTDIAKDLSILMDRIDSQ